MDMNLASGAHAEETIFYISARAPQLDGPSLVVVVSSGNDQYLSRHTSTILLFAIPFSLDS